MTSCGLLPLLSGCWQVELFTNPQKQRLDLGGGVATRLHFLRCPGADAGVSVDGALMEHDRGNLAIVCSKLGAGLSLDALGSRPQPVQQQTGALAGKAANVERLADCHNIKASGSPAWY